MGRGMDLIHLFIMPVIKTGNVPGEWELYGNVHCLERKHYSAAE